MDALSALELGLVGRAANLSDGRAEVVAEGPREAYERLLAALRSGSTPGHVHQVTERFTAPQGPITGLIERMTSLTRIQRAERGVRHPNSPAEPRWMRWRG